jgi:hypothetical protein
VSSIAEFTSKNSIESASLSFPSTTPTPTTLSTIGKNDTNSIDIQLAPNNNIVEQEASSSSFKRNESGRVSCKSIYSYLIKPIKNKFKIGCASSSSSSSSRKTKQPNKNFKPKESEQQLQPTPMPKPIFQYANSNNTKLNLKQNHRMQQQQHQPKPYFISPICLNEPVYASISSKYETVSVDKNILNLALANKFHNSIDPVYYLVQFVCDFISSIRLF